VDRQFIAARFVAESLDVTLLSTAAYTRIEATVFQEASTCFALI
jgi:hypothetical protein